MRLRRGNRQVGSATVELALLMPIIMTSVLFVIGVARIMLAAHAVQWAAVDAARAASIAREAGGAAEGGDRAAEAALSTQNLHCVETAVEVDVSQFAVPVGQRAQVVVTVTCLVDLGDVSGLTGLPGRFEVTKTARSPIDSYRERE
ncbi:MAG: pilus assembly protein [Micrococcales bacterium]|nr:pilus assembly protein [Micrococcales bacterium]